MHWRLIEENLIAERGLCDVPSLDGANISYYSVVFWSEQIRGSGCGFCVPWKFVLKVDSGPGFPMEPSNVLYIDGRQIGSSASFACQTLEITFAEPRKKKKEEKSLVVPF